MDSDLIFGLLLVLFVVVVLVSWVRGKRRRRAAYRRWAAQRGWDFVTTDPDLNRGWRAPVVRGGSVDLRVHRSFPEGDVYSFENSYHVGTGPSSGHTRRVTALHLGFAVPTIVIMPADKQGEADWGYVPVELDDPAFSARWYICTERPVEAATAAGLITPGFRRRLQAIDGAPWQTPTLAFGNDYLFAVGSVSPELGAIEAYADLLRDLARELPEL